jgi:hypothetical protein
MGNDLRWLVMEGYVTEFSDSKLFAPPAVAPQAAKKAEAGDDEHDPVDFPEVPAVAAVTPVADAPAPVPSTEAETVPTQPVPETAAPAAAEPVAGEPAEEPKPEAQV